MLINLDEPSYLFGTTILEIPLRWATLPLLKHLLSMVPTTKPRHLSTYLRLAARRFDAVKTLHVLFGRFHGMANTRRDFARGQLITAAKSAVDRKDSIGPIDSMRIKRENSCIFNAVMKWMGSGPKIPDKSKLIEDVFWLLNFKRTY